MLFSKNWLKEFVDIKVSNEELCEQLTMLGMEVEGYRSYKSSLTGDDAVIKMDITPNRGDCFSLLGVARELSALHGSKLIYPKVSEVKKMVESPLTVNICKEAPSYVGRFITALNLKKITPPIIKERLKLSGIRSINPVVDITNYVMLELGQPLHTFDFDKLQGNLKVRFSKNKERITLLDETKIKLDTDCLVIADEKIPVALAGIMGSLSTGVTAKTRSVYLESAFFKPEIIRGKARRYGMQTEASIRFERGVDFNLQTLALKKASLLIQQVLGGKFGPIQQFQQKSGIPKNKVISFNLSKVNSILGSNIKSVSVAQILKSLGLEIFSSKKRDTYKVKVPSWRFDLDIEVDLTEEIARIIGYEKLPEKSLQTNIRNSSDLINLSLRSSFQSLGYNEVITYSFIDRKEAMLTNKEEELISVENPISQKMSVMRPGLFLGLINTFSYNFNRGVEDLKIFEIGSIFVKKNKTKISEKVVVGGLISGNRKKLNWSEIPTKVDFYDLKGDLETIYSGYSFRPAIVPFLNPTKTAAVFKGKKQVGYLGSLNLKLMEKMDIKQEVHFFELNLDNFEHSKKTKFKGFSGFPQAQRDLSFIINSEVSSAEVMKLIIQKSGKELKEINIFDVYRGRGIPKGKKSLAFSLSWQASNRTMTDIEIDDIVKKIVSFLYSKLDAKLRN